MIKGEQTVLVLQGGGALGAYQAGVYEDIAEAGLAPDWVAGVSIGAINAVLIAGNRPEHRLLRLRGGLGPCLLQHAAGGASFLNGSRRSGGRKDHRRASENRFATGP
jgi:predicted acylesterase/phospholipase RssA